MAGGGKLACAALSKFRASSSESSEASVDVQKAACFLLGNLASSHRTVIPRVVFGWR